MVRTFQLTKALSRLTVIENMRLGATGQQARPASRPCSRRCGARQENANTERADALLERFKLDEKRDDFAGLAVRRPAQAAGDGPGADGRARAGHARRADGRREPALKQSLLGHVKSLREEGTTVLFVEHDMDMVRDISDWVIVMAQGKIIAEGPPDAVMGDQRVIDAYLGRPPRHGLTSRWRRRSSPRPRPRSRAERRASETATEEQTR